MRCHPDKNSHPRAEDAFKRLSAAYNTLADDTSRRRYDQNQHADIFSTGRNGAGPGDMYHG